MPRRKTTPEGEKPKKPKGKPRGGNSPVIGNNGLLTQPGDNSKYLQINVELLNMPDIDLHDAEQVRQRISDYYELYARYDTKPTVAGMAIALGMNRRTLTAIVRDYPTGGNGYMSALPKDVAQVIKKSYNLLENLWENYMQNGKVNPVCGIFLGKNNYGYRDQTETVIKPEMPQEEISVEEIKERYEPERLSGESRATLPDKSSATMVSDYETTSKELATMPSDYNENNKK